MPDVRSWSVALFPAAVAATAGRAPEASPGKLTYGSQGVGSTAQLSACEPEVPAGIKRMHLRYHGAQPPLTEKINRDIADVLKKPEVAAKLRRLELDPMGGGTADARQFIGEEPELRGRVITDSRIMVQ